DELVLRYEADRLSCEKEPGPTGRIEGPSVELARCRAVDFELIDGTIGVNKLDRRASLADEIAARAQCVPAGILLGHRHQSQGRQQRPPGTITRVAAE